MPFNNFAQAPSRRENPRRPALQSDYFGVSGCDVPTEGRDTSAVTKTTSLPSLKDSSFKMRRHVKQTIQEKLQVAKFEMVGKGGFGEVLKARSTAKEDKDELYALKIIKRETSDRDGFRKFNQASTHELQMLQELKHENIVRLYDHLYVNHHFIGGKRYFVLKMEFLERDLHDCVSKIGRTESPEVLNRFFQQVGGAVAYMHSQRIVHHDIKPGNIMVKFSPDQLEKPLLEQMSSCHYKLIDFGLATRYEKGVDDKVRGCTNRNGTKFYFCPEKANEETAYIPYAADAYALGVTALVILQGAELHRQMKDRKHSASQVCCALILQNLGNQVYMNVFDLLKIEKLRPSVGEWLKFLEGQRNGVL